MLTKAFQLCVIGAISECDTDTDAATPYHAALLFYRAVDKFETVRQHHHREHFKAGSAGGIIDNSAVDRRRLERRNDLGRVGAG